MSMVGEDPKHEQIPKRAMTSRPAAPESPLVDRLKQFAFHLRTIENQYAETMREKIDRDAAELMDRAATALSLAQTEIKEHMRVEDDLQARIAEFEKDRDGWKREAEMIGNAWQRELCDQGILYRHKTHWIDFMVLATRQVMALAKENGVVCCNQPELCAKTDCNKLLRYRLDATLKSRA